MKWLAFKAEQYKMNIFGVPKFFMLYITTAIGEIYGVWFSHRHCGLANYTQNSVNDNSSSPLKIKTSTCEIP